MLSTIVQLYKHAGTKRAPKKRVDRPVKGKTRRKTKTERNA